MRGFQYKKAVQALVVFATKAGGSLNKMKAVKLIWLADRLHLRRYGRTITGDMYFALPLGPVPSTTRDLLELSNLSESERDYSMEYIEAVGMYQYKGKSEPVLSVFSQTDIDVLETVYEHYKDLSHFQLSELSHTFPEWSKYESALKSGISSRFAISLDSFFENVDDGHGLFMDEEEDIKLSKDMFEEKERALSIF